MRYFNLVKLLESTLERMAVSLKNSPKIISFKLNTFFILVLTSCMSMQVDKYDVPKIESKLEEVTFELIQILNKGETYNASSEEFQKTEKWLQEAIQEGGFPNAKLAKGGENSPMHIKVKIDVYNPPWYRLILGYVNAGLTLSTLGILPYYSGHIQHVFYFEVTKVGKPYQNIKVEGPGLAVWWGWLAPWLGNRGDMEAQIVESWKLIVRRLSPQLEKAKVK